MKKYMKNENNIDNNDNNKKEDFIINLEGETVDEKITDLLKKLPEPFLPKKTLINKILEKIDIKLFSLFEHFILKYVRAKKFTQNKYDLLSKLRLATTILFLVVAFVYCPISSFLLKASLTVKIINVLISSSLYLIIVFLEYNSHLKNILKSILYMPIFLQQKNPHINFKIQLTNKITFITERPFRYSLLKTELFIYFVFFLFIAFVFAVTKIYWSSIYIFSMVTFIYILNLMDNYINYITDFDKPENKKKKEKEKKTSLTKLMQKLLDDLIRSLKPSPVSNQA
jgi:hypothetical protein